MVYICQAVLEKTDLEPCLEKVFAGVAHAVFRSDSAYIYIGRVKKLKDLSERLTCRVHAFESGILLHRLVASFVESQLFAGVRGKVSMDFPSMSACHAVRRPYATVLHE